MWIPRWLGEGYARLYSSFSRGIFTFDDVCKRLGLSSSRAHIFLSALRKSGALIDFRRGRPRLYRLLEPRSFMLVASGIASRPPNIQGEYVQLVYDVLRALRASLNPISMTVYGSVARGSAGPTSDVDILVVSDEFKGSLASRIDRLLEVERDTDIRDELKLLRSHGIHASLSFYPIRREEAGKLPPLLLDVAYEAAILLDDGFLNNLLSRLRSKLELIGAKRYVLQDDNWYWDLGPRASEVWAL
ncbi:MAG: nucleotidyltransferase domain-containing protein [Nitrososphaerota archaeon]